MHEQLLLGTTQSKHEEVGPRITNLGDEPFALGFVPIEAKRRRLDSHDLEARKLLLQHLCGLRADPLCGAEKNTRQPSSAARSMRSGTKSLPEIFAGRGWRISRESHTKGCPSTRERLAP